jgi:hypothetical protein
MGRGFHTSLISHIPGGREIVKGCDNVEKTLAEAGASGATS